MPLGTYAMSMKIFTSLFVQANSLNLTLNGCLSQAFLGIAINPGGYDLLGM